MTPGPVITQRQDVFGFIVDFKHAHDGNSPSIREISEHCGIGSTNTVLLRLKKLRKAGLIELNGAGKSRMISVVGATWTAPRVKESN